MNIRYTKAHGAKNDFLLTWITDLPPGLSDDELQRLARDICNRYTGVGADGWLMVDAGGDDPAIRLLNSDGSASEMSGNGTRCAAAFLIHHGKASGNLTIHTGAGPKHLRLLERSGFQFVFEMGMGKALYSKDELRVPLSVAGVALDATILNVGNPQCAVFVKDFSLDWRKIGRAIEWLERFPNRTNVSFVQPVDEHAIEVRFWERGAGETMSSGTGSTGAAFAALLRGVATSPIEVRTPAGPLRLRLDGEEMKLTGPAELISDGEFYWSEQQ